MSKVIVPWDLITNFVTDAFIGYGIPAAGLKATAATGLSPFTWIGSKPGSKIR